MSLNDPLANVLSSVMNAERGGEKEVVVYNSSKLIKQVLEIMQDQGYIGSFNEVEDSKGDFLEISLIGKINETGAVKPRHRIANDELKKFEKRFLPALDFGIIIISTNQGLMTHKEAREKGIGGVLISYCY